MKFFAKVLILSFLGFFLSNCSFLELIGLKSPPTTNAEYFTERIKMVVDRFSENRKGILRNALVLDFVDDKGEISQLGLYLASKFREEVAVRKLFNILSKGEETKALAAIPTATNYNNINSDDMEKISQVLNLDAVIVGTISDLSKGSNVDLIVRAIGTNNAKMISVGSVSIYRSKQVETLMKAKVVK